MTGLHHHEYPTRVSITEEVIDNQRIWVVYDIFENP